MGKNLGDDLREGKATLPLIIAMQRGTAAQKLLIQTAIQDGGLGQLETIVNIVRSTGAIDATRTVAANEAQRAIDALRGWPDNAYTRALLQLAQQLLSRRT